MFVHTDGNARGKKRRGRIMLAIGIFMRNHLRMKKKPTRVG
jgi:hypothetical protein